MRNRRPAAGPGSEALSNGAPLPGPRGEVYIGNLAAFEEDRLGFITRTRDTFGDHVRYSRQATFFHRLEDIETVLGRPTDFLVPQNFLAEPVPPEATEEWLEARIRMHPPLSPRSLSSQLSATARTTYESMDSISRNANSVKIEGQSIPDGIAIRSTCRAMFGDSIPDLEAQSARMLTALSKIIGNPMAPPAWVPTPARSHIRREHSRLSRMIDEHMQKPAGGVASQLVKNRDNPSPRLRSMVAGSLLAGHRVPAAGMSWT